MPAAYVVTGADGRPPVRLRLGEVFAPLRRASETAVVLLFGLWPIWAIVSLTFLLIWASAMGASP